MSGRAMRARWMTIATSRWPALAGIFTVFAQRLAGIEQLSQAIGEIAEQTICWR